MEWTPMRTPTKMIVICLPCFQIAKLVDTTGTVASVNSLAWEFDQRLSAMLKTWFTTNLWIIAVILMYANTLYLSYIYLYTFTRFILFKQRYIVPLGRWSIKWLCDRHVNKWCRNMFIEIGKRGDHVLAVWQSSWSGECHMHQNLLLIPWFDKI